MGLFNRYLKEGPGVEKDAPKKKGIFLFFEIYFRKFFKLLKAGLYYMFESLPFLIIGVLFFGPLISRCWGIEEAIAGIADNNSAMVMFVFIACGLLNLFGSGPAAAGYAYVTRCFVRGEHTWVWSDGWDKIKENFKNAILLIVLDFVIIFAAVYGIYFYGAFAADAPAAIQKFFGVSRGIVTVSFLLYTMMHIFLYQIMVTYECGFKNLLKNSFIMMMAKLPMCLLLTAVTSALFILLFVYFGKLGIFVYAILGISLTRFPLEFYAARVIEKNIKRVEKRMQQSVDEGAEE
ncbi:MAG: DUF624 domain-containing protein [Clostridia bacterium]|jgi:uncharacterized membrane protein YesL|nr:DUF624 domain-containing protein [Clostridia bacterium]